MPLANYRSNLSQPEGRTGSACETCRICVPQNTCVQPAPFMILPVLRKRVGSTEQMAFAPIPPKYMASPIWFIALKRFGPADGERWSNFVAWSKLVQLTELVSLDSTLCPRVIDRLSDEDWNHNIQADYLVDFFLDYDYLIKRVASIQDVQLLAVSKNPTEMRNLEDSRFVECGFDLIEETGSISSLSNCGGFPESFDNCELTTLGLLPSLARARQVQASLKAKYPNEHHAACDVWHIWRLQQGENPVANK